MSTTKFTLANHSCQCFDINAQAEWTNSEYLFSTNEYWEISRLQCAHCGMLWLRAFLEYESFSQSGRHYRTPISKNQLQDIIADDAISILEAAEFRIAGGSYFNGKLFVSQNPAPLNRNL